MLGVPAADAHPDAASQSIDNPGNDRAALQAVVHDLCTKQVAMLGEAAHGDGRTDSFKVALVEQLVTKCGYNAVFFEASHYDFLAIDRRLRRHEEVTADMVSSAIGGLWKFDLEFKPLVPFLLAEAKSGRLALGGLDFQLGALESFYANDAMPAELTSYLDESQRAQCREAFRHRTYWNYPESAPYSAAQHDELLACVSSITRAIDARSGADPQLRAEQLDMLVNIRRSIEPDLSDATVRNGARDRAMFLNLRWLVNRLPPHRKIIVWTATAHAARDITPQMEMVRPFGSYVHETYGPRAFALGFTARSGSYRYARKTNKQLPAPPPGSLEESAIAKDGDATAYLGAPRLAKLGPVPGAAFGHQYHIFGWNSLLDGIVVFPAEHPPHSTRSGYE